ncbi:fluoride efflux transporter CrcB [Flavobacterium agricola]|uniref:Fluoride-specific ion channel FluC n=1 Tax=Flavobacterium agricola TaxID=2870839 RepID=A0ABY6M336_9FLAO|nr:fluoride efflux transporter CrcB [Flavobacterium agricola]UYW02220.1 fluoride efflux transporter CrcB [Flavobacterium agricola]
MIKNIILVAVGGGIGSVFRYLIGYSNIFPNTKMHLSTLAANLIGCFVIGFLSTYFLNKINHDHLSLLFITGFCGGFTTFSSFALENQKMMQTNQSFDSFIYIILSVVVGIALVFAGQKLAQMLA